jgi:hypothetical protein
MLVRNHSQFVHEYHHLFTASLRKAIVMQAPDCLFANWQTVMMGHGEVWFEEDKNLGIAIKTLNVPMD